MSELEERLQSVLSNPGELDRLAKMARQLMGGGAADPDGGAYIGNGCRNNGACSGRIACICAGIGSAGL